MRAFNFVKKSISTGKTEGQITFMAETEEEAVESAYYIAKVRNNRAKIGVTGRVIYPHGLPADEAWVLEK